MSRHGSAHAARFRGYAKYMQPQLRRLEAALKDVELEQMVENEISDNHKRLMRENRELKKALKARK